MKNIHSDLQNSTSQILNIANKYRDIRLNGGEVDPKDIKQDITQLEQIGLQIDNVDQLIKDIEVQSLNKNFDFKFDTYLSRPQDQPTVATYTDSKLRDSTVFNQEKNTLQNQVDNEVEAIKDTRNVLSQLKDHQTNITAQRQAEIENHQQQIYQQPQPQQQSQQQAGGQQYSRGGSGGGSGISLFSNNQKNEQRLKEKLDTGMGRLLAGGLRAAALNINSKFTSSTDLAFKIESDLSTLMTLNDPKSKTFTDLSSRAMTNINTLNGRLVGANMHSTKSNIANSTELKTLMNAAKNVTAFQDKHINGLKALNDLSQPKFDFTSSLNSLKDSSKKLTSTIKSIASGLKNKLNNSISL